MVCGSQLTITWHVDDLKISHVDKEVLEDLLNQLNGAFRKNGPLTIHRGKKHDYLGMWLDFSLDGKVQVQMFDYIDNMLANLPKDMCGTVTSPAADHLFTIYDTLFSLLVDLGANSCSPCGLEEHQIAVDSTPRSSKCQD